MTILINDDIEVAVLQKAFNEMFPYLRLVIHYNKKNEVRYDYASGYYDMVKLSQCRSMHSNGVLELRQDMTVADFINCLKIRFGLNVDIKRKSGKAWLKTTLTDKWTLGEQNEQGKLLSAHLSG